MQFGFYLPTIGPTARPDPISEIAKRGDSLGFHCMVVADHIVLPRQIDSPYPYTVGGVYPGAETGEHIHQYDYVVVPGLDGVLKIELPDGSETLAELKAGEAYFRQKGVHHNVINTNGFEFSFVEVEFK